MQSRWAVINGKMGRSNLQMRSRVTSLCLPFDTAYLSMTRGDLRALLETYPKTDLLRTPVTRPALSVAALLQDIHA